jgi:TonB family protein
MKRWLVLPLLCAALCAHAQSEQSRLLGSGGYMEAEGYFMPLEEGGDSVATEFTYLNADSTITKELRRVSDSRLLRRDIYRGNTPVGTWLQQYEQNRAPMKTVYDIDPEGVLSSCASGYLYQLGNASLSFGGRGESFTPPVLQGGQNINEFISARLRYPNSARDAGIHGVVRVKGTLTEAGELTDLAISKSLSRDVDAEVFRVVKTMRFEKPALLNGQPVRLCISLPVTFEMQ